LIKLILDLIEHYFGLSPEVTTIVSIGVLVIFFLLVREIILWYFKMNRLISIQKEQTEILKELLEHYKK